MREATSPTGRVWECFLEWEGRRAMHASLKPLRRTAERRAKKRANDSKLDLLDGCDVFGFDSMAGLGIMLLIMVVVLIGPEIAAALFAVVELGAIVLLIAIGYVGRTLFRRPWRVVAVSDEGTVWAWRQVGLRASRRLIEEIATGVVQGHDPSMIAADRLEAENPTVVDDDAPLGLMADGRFRWMARVVMAVAAVITFVVLVQRL